MAAVDTIAELDRLASRHVTVINGRRIVWRRFGSGPDLVLLHGGHGSWLHWVRNVEALAAHHTLWLPDLPGFGESDSIEPGGTDEERLQRLIDGLADAMLALPELSLPTDMVAFSFGAVVGARIAEQGLVRRLALIAPAGHGEAKPPRAPLVKWRVTDPEVSAAALRHNLVTLMLHPDNLDAMAIEIYEAQCRAARFKVRHIVRDGGFRRALDAIDNPLLLLWGAHDTTAMPHKLGPHLAMGRLTTSWRVVEGAGHWVQYERAAQVNAMLDEWFEAPEPAAAAHAALPARRLPDNDQEQRSFQ